MTAVAVPPWQAAGAAHRTKAAGKLAALIEDAEWLLETGVTWTAATVRLGYRHNPEALERRLGRAGRWDLITALRAREAGWRETQNTARLRDAGDALRTRL